MRTARSDPEARPAVRGAPPAGVQTRGPRRHRVA
jgi:hypothetical protein